MSAAGRLGDLLRGLAPQVPGVLTGRRAARTGPDGDLVPPAGQDRNRWDAAMIEEGAAPAVAARPR
ncbi:DUF6596 domain-containing protein [Streptosporangium roseum]|uniref:DUF6596 domain-containing protein n=1 Tax=Streptosporangium roseum TaxID=2001 RepID=UPI0033327EBB